MTDIHTRRAADTLGIPEHEVTPKQRRIAKALNFSLLYGGVSERDTIVLLGYSRYTCKYHGRVLSAIIDGAEYCSKCLLTLATQYWIEDNLEPAAQEIAQRFLPCQDVSPRQHAKSMYDPELLRQQSTWDYLASAAATTAMAEESEILHGKSGDDD